jgi:uncharacterized circularly permuted ATP-grasp superfamily protein
VSAAPAPAALYAADLGRRPDGGFCVLGDRTQAPSGAGYALGEPSGAVAHLAEHLPRHARPPAKRSCAACAPRSADLAPRVDDSPHSVMLTPDPATTYFEHAFLASLPGCTLAQGDDLTVRDQRSLVAPL